MARLFMAILLPLFLAPSVSVAQTPDSLVKGQRVRVVARCEVAPDCREGDPRWIHVGQLEALDRDSLHIRARANNAELVIPTSSIARLYVVDGTKGHFWVGAGIGLLGGALIGGVIGSTTQFCIDECTDAQAQAGAIEAGVILGAPAGFLLGGITGALIRSDRWRLVSIKDHRIGVAPRLDARGFSVDVRF
jgi:hypothetical protein